MMTNIEKTMQLKTSTPRVYLLGNLPVFLFFALLAITPIFVKDEYIRHLMVVGLLFGAQAMVSDLPLAILIFLTSVSLLSSGWVLIPRHWWCSISV